MQSSSRLTKTKRKKVVRQTVLLIVGAVILGLAFIALVIPVTIRLLSITSNQDVSFEAEDTIAPQPPSIAAPPFATNEPKLALSGFSEADSRVILLHNDSQVAETTAKQDGSFSFDINLKKGENTITAFARDNANNESDTSQVYITEYDVEPPAIDLLNVENGQQIQLRQNQNFTIRGETEPRARIYLNDRLIFARENGSFNTTYQLQEGDNELKFKAVDRAGNETESTITINFKL